MEVRVGALNTWTETRHAGDLCVNRRLSGHQSFTNYDSVFLLFIFMLCPSVFLSSPVVSFHHHSPIPIQLPLFIIIPSIPPPHLFNTPSPSNQPLPTFFYLYTPFPLLIISMFLILHHPCFVSPTYQFLIIHHSSIPHHPRPLLSISSTPHSPQPPSPASPPSEHDLGSY